MRGYISQMYRDIYGPLKRPTRPKTVPPGPPRPPSPSKNLKKMNNPTLGELPIYAQHLKTVEVPGVEIPKLKFKKYLSDLEPPYTSAQPKRSDHDASPGER